MSEIKRKRLVIHGRVQGVSFRYAIRRRADSAGVGGWVRNRSDGAVEVVLEGSAAALAEVVELCRTGPPRARVDDVEVTDEPAAGLTGFRIR